MINVKSRDIMAKDVWMILKLLLTNLPGHLRYIIYLHFNLWMPPDFLTSFPSVNFSHFYWHNSPQLTCSQRHWLHSSVGRASHRYREVTGSNPVEVLNFFFSGFFMQLHKLHSLRRSFLHFHNSYRLNSETTLWRHHGWAVRVLDL